MQRFFVPPEALQTEPVRLSGDVAHQIARVLRLAPGDEIILLDNTGAAYLARLLTVTPRETTAAIVDVVTPTPEWGVRLALYQAMPRGKKIEWVLQKGTELGVSAFVPMISARCQGLTPDDFGEAKLARWRRIVAEAAEQSERAQLPAVQPAVPFAEAVQLAAQADLAIVATLHDTARPLREALGALEQAPASVALLIGPEGGFSPEEVMLAAQAGVAPISLGPRVLRTETAALVAFSAILYALGELG
jgi:16S rRNA (uracil1498-N3)-methyltransferase